MKHVWHVPVTIADYRVATVIAGSEAEAREKMEQGRYKRLGRSTRRGVLTVGKPERADRQ
jgi:hypothetical protein